MTDDTNEQDPNGLSPSDPGAKLDAGKLQADLMLQFPRAMKAFLSICTYGAEKYSRGGWQHVDGGIERYRAAQIRHMLAGETEELDSDSGLPHQWHELWNVLAVVELSERAKDEQ